VISVVVPAYNAERTLRNCLDALEAQTMAREAYEVIVVDDGSTDGTAEIARSYDVRLVQQDNAGPAAARNRGARAALGDLLLFTDADCAPVKTWIARMAEPFSDPEVVGAKGVYRTRQRSLVARFVQLEYERKYARMRGQKRIDFVDTYSAAYRRDVLLANDGFETLFPTSSVEDQEFSFRLARKGYRLVFVPDAIVYHVHDVTPFEYGRRKLTIGVWKALLLRWHPERAMRDSHTPQVLKLQLALAGLICLSLLVSPFWSPAGWAALAALLAFFASALPFLIEILRKDAPVLSAAPFLLLLRALTLGVGLAVGFVRFYGQEGGRRTPISGLDRLLKRVIDLVGSIVGLILAAPLLALLAAAIKLDSRGPVLFVQRRAGENGRPFRMLKLRTMVEGAEEMVTEMVDPASLPATALKRRRDPRVTRVGRFLRRASLDELPQLWNVLKGEMSLVGPRPEELRVVRHYSDWHRQRLAVKPGLTGPMQVNGRADLSLDERVELELDYVYDYSLWRDLRLLAHTFAAVISGRGAR
jgi:lipopolysaccharide/colanic/teichoic acid biosynthesis glycosyltransferase/glycosyltransferase involved in cell wall biosynthesis